MVERIFGSHLRTELLGCLLSHSNESFFVRQMEQFIDEHSTNSSRELRRLEQVGIVQSEKRANLRYYKVDEKYPFYEEMKGLLLKTVGAPAEIKKAYKGIEGIERAFIYGSLAKGEAISGSDIDVLIVGDIDEDKLVEDVPRLKRMIGKGN